MALLVDRKTLAVSQEHRSCREETWQIEAFQAQTPLVKGAGEKITNVSILGRIREGERGSGRAVMTHMPH